MRIHGLLSAWTTPRRTKQLHQWDGTPHPPTTWQPCERFHGNQICRPALICVAARMGRALPASAGITFRSGRFRSVGNLSRFADRPFAFFAHYVRMRPISHAVVAAAVLAAVGCSVGTQYGVRLLVDALSGPGRDNIGHVWTAFWILIALVACDNLLWRVASYIASYVCVAVTGDLRNDLFRHLTGHSPRYFADRLPGMLTSRITATSNAVFTTENMFVWNVAPPCVATLGSIALIATVSVPMEAGLAALAAVLVVAMFRLAAAGMPLHHAFADRAAAGA